MQTNEPEISTACNNLQEFDIVISPSTIDGDAILDGSFTYREVPPGIVTLEPAANGFSCTVKTVPHATGNAQVIVDNGVYEARCNVQVRSGELFRFNMSVTETRLRS